MATLRSTTSDKRAVFQGLNSSNNVPWTGLTDCLWRSGLGFVLRGRLKEGALQLLGHNPSVGASKNSPRTQALSARCGKRFLGVVERDRHDSARARFAQLIYL